MYPVLCGTISYIQEKTKYIITNKDQSIDLSFCSCSSLFEKTSYRFLLYLEYMAGLNWD